CELLVGRDTEADHPTAGRVDIPEDTLGGAILAAGVHALEDDQKGVCAGGEEQLLKFAELLCVFVEGGLARDLVDYAGQSGLELPDRDLAARLYGFAVPGPSHARSHQHMARGKFPRAC